MKRRQFWLGIAATLGMLILILDSKTAVTGARAGLELCIGSLIPSLFPFFVLSSMLTNMVIGSPVPLLRPLGRLLQIPKGCESLLLPAFLGGYPAGAQSIGQAYSQGALSKQSAQRLLSFCNNPGPAFLFGILGTQFPDNRMLWHLWGILLVSSCLTAWLYPGSTEAGQITARSQTTVSDCLYSSVKNMGIVCGWVIFFRIWITFLERWVFWIFPSSVRIALSGFTELTNGCCLLFSISDVRHRFLLCASMLSFGGLCVTMQTASVIGDLTLLPYLSSKLLQSLLCTGISAAVLYDLPLLLPPIAIICWIIKKAVAKHRTMMYNEDTNQWRNQYAVSKKNRARLRLLSARSPIGR